jgi:hypothetical protein
MQYALRCKEIFLFFVIFYWSACTQPGNYQPCIYIHEWYRIWLFFYDWVLELFRRCDIFCLFSFSIGYWNCSDDVIFCLFSFLIGYWNCSYDVIFFVCSHFRLTIGTVPTMWYFLLVLILMIFLWFFFKFDLLICNKPFILQESFMMMLLDLI